MSTETYTIWLEPPANNLPPRFAKEALKQEVLSWANGVRAQFGAAPLTELPKGLHGDKFQCVVARCFNDVTSDVATNYSHTTLFNTNTHHANVRHHANVLSHPRHVAMFIQAFDQKCFPELIDNSSGYVVIAEDEAIAIPKYTPKPQTSMVPVKVMQLFAHKAPEALCMAGGWS